MRLPDRTYQLHHTYAHSVELASPYLQIVVWMMCIALALFGLVSYWRAQGQRDYGPAESVYTYVGWSWAQGYWPYRDSWDHKGPTVYATAMLRTVLAGNEPNTLGGQDIVLGGLMAIFLAGAAYALWGGGFGPPVALALGILLWTQWPPEYQLVSTPGCLIALFTTGTIFFALAAMRRTCPQESVVLAALTGIFAGLAICTKPNAVAGPVVAAGLIWWTGQPRPVAERLRLLVIAAAGAAVPVIVIVAVFYSAGALGELIDTYVLFNSIRGRLIFSEIGIFNLFLSLIQYLRTSGVFPLSIAVGLATTVAAVRGQFSRARGRSSGDRGELIILFWLILECILAMSNEAAEQHMYAILPALALGGTWLVLWPSRYAFVSGRLWSLVVFILIVIRPVLNASALQPPTDEIGHRNSSWNHVIQIIDDTVGPRDTVLSLDNWDGAGLLSLALRRNASRYVHPVAPYTRGYASDARWAEVLNDIKGKRAPKLVIVSVLPLTAPAGGQRTVEWALSRFDDPWAPFPDRTAYPHLEAFKAYIAANYRLDSCLADLCLLRPL